MVVGTSRAALGDGARAPTIASDGAIDVASVRKHLDVELAGIGRTRWPTRVDIREGPWGWHLRISFPSGIEAREISSAAAGEATIARVLALVVAEAARAHSTPAETAATTSPVEAPSPEEEKSLTAPPRATAAVDSPAPRPKPAPTTDEIPVRRPGASPRLAGAGSAFVLGADAAFGVSMFGPMGTLALEPRIVLRAEHRSKLGLELHAFYISSRAEDLLGTAKLEGLGGGLSASYGLATWQAMSVRAGPRLDVSAVRGSGEASDNIATSSLVTPLVAAAAEVLLRTALIGPTSVSFAVDAGYVVHGVTLRADDRRSIVVNGLSLGARVGIGIQ